MTKEDNDEIIGKLRSIFSNIQTDMDELERNFASLHADAVARELVGR